MKAARCPECDSAEGKWTRAGWTCAQCGSGPWIDGGQATQCRDLLAEPGWDEGFTCRRPIGHEPPHRDESDVNNNNTGVTDDGRPYTWAHEWRYA